MTIIPTPISDALDARNQQYQAYLDQYTADQASARAQASLIAEYRLRSPGLPAGTYLSMAQSGFDPAQLDAVSSAYVPTPDANTVKTNQGSAQPQPKKKSSGGGFLGAITGGIGDVFGDVGKAASWVNDEIPGAKRLETSGQSIPGVGAVKDALGTAAGAVVDEVVKPATRLGTAALSLPVEAGQNILQQFSPGSHATDRSLIDDFKATTLGQMIAHHDLGTGYLPPPSERAAAGAIQRRVRGTVGTYAQTHYGDSGPQAATIGRNFAASVFTPGSTPYNVASGAVDFYVSAKYDPANVLGRAWHASAVTRGTFAAADELADAGAYNGIRKYFNPTQFSDWIDSTKGRVFSSAVADEASPAVIDAMTKHKLPSEVVEDLARAKTPEEVGAVMKDAVSAGLRDVPKTSIAFGPGGAGYAVAKTLGSHDWRIANMTPGFGFDINDNRAAINYVDRAAANALIKGSAKESLVNRMIAAVNTTNDPFLREGKIYQVMNQLGSQIRQSVAGADYLNTAEGKRFSSDLLGAARASEPDAVRQMLETRLPGKNISDKLVIDIMHTAQTTPSETERAQRVLEVLGRDKPNLSWIDRHAAHIPEDATSGVDIPRYRDEASPLASLMKSTTTRSDVRAWLSQAFPNETFEDSTVDDIARMAKGDSRSVDIGDLLAQNLDFGRGHQSAAVAQRLGRWSTAQTLEARQAYIQAGAEDSIPSIKIGDRIYKIQGMHLPEEALNGFVPGPNADDVRRNTSMFNNLLGADPTNNRPYFSLLANDKGHERLLLTALDRTSGVWRKLAVTRPALVLRVLGGQQLAMAMDGQDSIFNHPIRSLAHVLHSDDAVDLNDGRFLDSLEGQRNQWRNALGTDPASNFGIDKVQLGRTARVTPEMKDFVPAWGSEVTQLSASPLTRQVTDALLSPTIEREGTQVNALNELKQSFWDGPLARYRNGLLSGADPMDDSHWLNVLHQREGADKYIDTIVNRVMEKSVGDEDLMRAISSGTIGGKALGNGKVMSEALRAKLADLHADDIYPALVKGRVATGIESKGLLDKAQQWFWQNMVDVPSSKITKQPLGAQLYAQEVARLVGPEVDWHTVLDAMEKGDTSSLRGVLENGPSQLTASEVDALARTHVLNSLDRYIYNGHQRAQFTDIFHTLIPFGEVFRQEMKRWATLSADNLPNVLHRGSQGIQNARDEGWFFQNPTTGEESVHIPLPGIVQSLIAKVVPGAQVDPGMGLSAPVAGFNIVGQGLPGFGAVAAVPADAILQHMPGGNSIRSLLEPYGPPDTSGGISGLAQSLAPSWLRKIISGFDQDPAKDRMYNSTLVSTIIAKQSAHPEDYPNTTEGMAKLLSDANAAARNVLVIRGLAQAILPSPPSLDQKIKINDHWVELSGIVDAWRKIEQDHLNNGGSMSDAVAEFINTYGDNATMAMIPQTEPTIYGLSASQGMADWRAANGDFATKYRNVWPLFAPAPGSGATDPNAKNISDYNNYLFQLKDGSRKLLDPTTRFELRDYRIGSMLYDRARSQLSASPNGPQRAWLAAVREKIGELYPGYAAHDGQFPPGAIGKVQPDVAMREVAQAATDPTVAHTPMAQAIVRYDRARAEAIDAIGTTSTTPFASQQAAPYRAWLRQVAEYLTQHYHGFGTVFDYVYSGEVQDKSTDNVLSPQDAAAVSA